MTVPRAQVEQSIQHGFHEKHLAQLSMKRNRILQELTLVVFVLAFLADAINIDLLLGLKSFDRDGDPDSVDSALLTPTSSQNLLTSLSFSKITPKSQKTKLELVDVDSPSLEAAYVSRDEIMPFIRKTTTFTPPGSANKELNFYSLCKLQI